PSLGPHPFPHGQRQISSAVACIISSPRLSEAQRELTREPARDLRDVHGKRIIRIEQEVAFGLEDKSGLFCHAFNDSRVYPMEIVTRSFRRAFRRRMIYRDEGSSRL